MCHREVKDFVKWAEGLGWTLLPARKHIKLQAPDRSVTVYTSRTPSDRRSLKNARAELKRKHNAIARSAI